jgi:putative spermidine/putrescine transport system substrate-binding protein
MCNFVRGVLAATAVVVVASGLCRPAAAEERFDGVTIRIATYGGPWREIMDQTLSPKFAALGGKIEFVTGSPQVNFAKLIAARGQTPFDVFEVLDAQVPDFEQGDYLLPIDYAKLPNTQDLAESQRKPKLVAAWLTQEAICYNTAKFKELGLAPPTTYKDLAQPALAGHVMIPDINSGGGLSAFGGMAHAAGGGEVKFQPALDLVKSMKGAKFWTQGDQLTIAFQNGDIYAGMAHAGWCLRTKNVGVPVASVFPKIQGDTAGVAKEGWLGILKGTKNVAAAHWLLNAYVEANYQLAFAVKDGVVPVNRKAIAEMGKDPTFATMLQLDPALIAHEMRVDYTKVVVSDWTDGWNRMIAQ